MGTFVDWFQRFLESQSLGGTRLAHLDDAPARRLGGGWQPKRAGVAGVALPTPPRGGPIEQRPSRRDFACPIHINGKTLYCSLCKLQWVSDGTYKPDCPRRTSSSNPEHKSLGNASLEDLFGEVLARLDPDPKRQGIAETPARAAKAWRYWCSGYGEDVDGLFKTFEDGAEGYDEMVVVHNIPVLSHCEHHMASISGIAHVGYIPNGRVVGLSKLARVVDTLSRRLQVQERLTVQVADAIERNLSPRGVGVIIKASHACMSSRGVRIHGSVTTTSALRGCLHEGPARAEFMSLCAAAERKLE